MNVDPGYWEAAKLNADAISTLASKALVAIRERVKMWEQFEKWEAS